MVEKHCYLIFCLWPGQNAVWMKSKKRWFKLSNVTLKSFSAFWPTKNSTIQLVEWHLKVIFALLTRPKFDFGEVGKAMYQVVARQWEHVFILLTSQICALDEVDKAMFQWFSCHIELLFGLLTNPKCELVEIEKALFLRHEMALSTSFQPLDQPKMRHGWNKKLLFYW